MTVNVHNIESVITAKLNGTLTDDEILLYAKAIEQLRTGSVFTVDIVSQLPNVNSVPDGALYFVEADRVLYRADRVLARYIGLAAERQIWSWGCNGSGRLGDDTITERSSPVSVVGGFTDWCAVAARLDHSAAIRANGTAWSWGCNRYGQLGDGTITDRSSPISVIGGFTDWCAISGGNRGSLAIRTNGTMWSWGVNTAGQLGDGTVVSKRSPVSVLGTVSTTVFGNWCAISAGSQHSLALRSNGTAWSWGFNVDGRLGDGTITDRSSPVSVVGGFTDWCVIAAGDGHSAAIRTNGTAWSWGFNGQDQLGHGTPNTFSRSSPVIVVGGFTDWCAISAGNYHSLAIRTNGTAWAWGRNNAFGQLGDNTITNRSSPVSVVGGFTDWCGIAAGGGHSLAIRTNGTAWSWGNNGSGHLGDGTVVSKRSPVSVVGGFTDWCAIAVGAGHSLAIRISG